MSQLSPPYAALPATARRADKPSEVTEATKLERALLVQFHVKLIAVAPATATASAGADIGSTVHDSAETAVDSKSTGRAATTLHVGGGYGSKLTAHEQLRELEQPGGFVWRDDKQEQP